MKVDYAEVRRLLRLGGAGALQVVRHTRQVVGEQVVGAGLVALQPVALDAVAVGLVDQHEVFVLRQGHAIGEVQAVAQRAHRSVGGQFVQAAVPAGLEDRTQGGGGDALPQ